MVSDVDSRADVVAAGLPSRHRPRDERPCAPCRPPSARCDCRYVHVVCMPIACAHARGCRPDARIRVSPPAVRTAVAPNGRPTVLVAEKLGAGGVEMLKDVADVKTALNMSKEELLDVISQADALVIRSATKARPLLVERWQGCIHAVNDTECSRIYCCHTSNAAHC